MQTASASGSAALGQKIENFTASFAKTVAHQRGRNEAWIEEAVRKSSALDEREALKLHVIDLVAPNLPNLLIQATGRRLVGLFQPSSST